MAKTAKTAKSTGKSAKKSAAKAPAKSAAKTSPPATAGGGATSPFVELRQRMDQLFDDFMQGWPSRSLARSHLFDFDRLAEPFGLGRLGGDMINVRFDLSESDDGLEVTAELPGLDEKDIDVTLADGVLTIKGEKKAESETKKKDYHLSERSYGSFARSFRVPDSVDEAKVKAAFEKGVLSVTLPKQAEAKRKQKKIAISKG